MPKYIHKLETHDDFPPPQYLTPVIDYHRDHHVNIFQIVCLYFVFFCV